MLSIIVVTVGRLRQAENAKARKAPAHFLSTFWRRFGILKLSGSIRVPVTKDGQP